MNSRAVAPEAFASHDPTEVATYLESTGWERVGGSAGATIWVIRSDRDEFEALLPADRGVRDYAARIADIVEVVSVVERRPEPEIWRDISAGTLDCQYIRTFPDTPPGTTPIDDAVTAFECARNLMAAAAFSVSTETPRAVQPARKPADVTRFLHEVRVGPTAAGSFVLSILTPVPSQGGRDLVKVADGNGVRTHQRVTLEPFQRRVSLRLYEAVHAAHEIAGSVLEGDVGIDSFARALPAGISANLCEALVGFGGTQEKPFEITFGWSLSLPIRRPTPGVTFPPEMISILRHAARELREGTGEQGVQVTGHVVRLHREGRAGAGEITIAGYTDTDADRLRRIRMKLSSGDYEHALRAHSLQTSVSVRGNLLLTGNRWRLRNAHDFRVESVPEHPS